MKQVARFAVTIALTLVIAVSMVAPLLTHADPATATEQAPTGAAAMSDLANGEIRVNCGGPAYTDTQGRLWQADQVYGAGSWGFTAAGSGTYSVTQSISGTVDMPLYQSQRASPGQYRFDVPNGNYQVELRFAEIYYKTFFERKFTVKVQGVDNQLMANLNVQVAAGGSLNAFDTTLLATVTSGQLVVEFLPGSSGSSTIPMINAIRVTPVSTTLPAGGLRFNAGGYDYTDSSGNRWFTDQKYAGGQTASTTTAIANTNDQLLFQTNRFNMNGYSFPVSNGVYNVDLLLAELYTGVTAPGQRVFDVSAEGQTVLTNVDPYALAGGRFRAITQTFQISVLDAQMNISFTKKATSAQPAIVNAIAVRTADSAPPGNWGGFAPTGWLNTQSPAASVQVVDTLSGLNVTSGQYAYSTNGGSSFSAWQPAGVSGQNATTATQTISVAAIPFNQDSATQNVVKLRIADMGGNLGESPHYVMQIDTLPPQSSVTAPANGAAVGSAPVTIQGVATDAAAGVQAVDVSTDGGASSHAATGTGTWSLIWTVPGEGNYNIRSRARDNLGRVESPGPGITVTADSTPPVTFITAPANGGYISTTTYMISGSAFDSTSGVQRVEVSTNGGASWTTASGANPWTYLWTPPSQGSYAIRARAVDNAGNVDAPGTGVTAFVDTVAPASSITDPTPGRVINGSAYTVSGSANDDDTGSGLAAVEISTDGATWNAANGSTSWYFEWNPLPPDGHYTVRSRGRDMAGNLQSPPAAVSVIVDSAAPASAAVVTGTAGLSGWYVSSLTVGLISSDAGSGVRNIFYLLDSGSWQTYTTPIFLSSDGLHRLRYYAVDNSGNAEIAQSVALPIDTVLPTSSAGLSGTGGGLGWYRSPVGVTMTGYDGSSGLANIRYSLDGAAWTSYSGAFVIGGEGSHTLLYYAVDNAGNTENTHTVTMRIDTMQPTSVIVAPSHGQVIAGGNFVIQGTASDAAGGAGLNAVDVSIDGGVWMPAQGAGSWSFVWTPPGSGSHNIRARAVDGAGNVEALTPGIWVTVDTSRPSTYIATPYNGQIISSPFVITGTASDMYSSVSFIEVSTNGGASWTQATLLSPVSWVYTWTAPNDGPYNLRSRGTDPAGNSELPGAGINVVVDTIAPVSAITSPHSGQLLRGSSITIAGTASDVGAGVKRVEVSIDGGAWLAASGAESWQFTWSPVGADGAHTIRSRAIDVAGNAQSPDPGVAITLDNTKPLSRIEAPAPGLVITASQLTISGSSSDATAGVTDVQVSIQRSLDGFFWSGSEWISDEAWLPTDGSTAAWTYFWSDLPQVGLATIRSRATDNAGNVETPAPGAVVTLRRGYDVSLPVIVSGLQQ